MLEEVATERERLKTEVEEREAALAARVRETF